MHVPSVSTVHILVSLSLFPLWFSAVSSPLTLPLLYFTCFLLHLLHPVYLLSTSPALPASPAFYFTCFTCFLLHLLYLLRLLDLLHPLHLLSASFHLLCSSSHHFFTLTLCIYLSSFSSFLLFPFSVAVFPVHERCLTNYFTSPFHVCSFIQTFNRLPSSLPIYSLTFPLVSLPHPLDSRLLFTLRSI